MGLPRVYFIIDALDECEEIEELMKLINKITSWKSPSKHILIASRKKDGDRGRPGWFSGEQILYSEFFGEPG